MKFLTQVTTVTATCLLLTSCLLTRTDVKEVEQKRQMQDQVVNLQKNTAETGSRFSEIENDLRQVNGRVEVLEDRLQKVSGEKDKSIQGTNELVADANKRTLTLQEEVTKLSQQVATLQAEMAAIKDVSVKPRAEKVEKKDAWNEAEDLFKSKDYKKAAMSYSKYRETNPKSKRMAEATLKIGVCFQELGLKEDAKAFYDEVIAKYATSNEAKKAKSRLKSLK